MFRHGPRTGICQSRPRADGRVRRRLRRPTISNCSTPMPSGENPGRQPGDARPDRTPRSPSRRNCCSDLRLRCLSGARAAAPWTAGRQHGAVIDDVLGKLEAAGRDAADYKDTLSAATGELGGERSPADLRKLVDGLIAATRAMEQRTKSLEGELQASSAPGHRTARQAGRCAQGKPHRSPDQHRQPQGVRRRGASGAEGAWPQGEEVSLLLCDIDHFKKFNDSWGHQTGDQVLRLVAAACRKTSRAATPRRAMAARNSPCCCAAPAWRRPPGSPTRSARPSKPRSW